MLYVRINKMKVFDNREGFLGLFNRSAELLSISAILFFGWKTYQRMSSEMLWRKIARRSLLGQTEQMLPEYERLRSALSGNELFLYNYTAELNVSGHYDKSLRVARECERLWADYDLRMLMADNCQQLQQYEEAEQYYRKAALMCPVKFMPLYCLAKLYDETGDKSRAQELAKIILNKKIKIPSSTIAFIQEEMRQLIETEKNDSATQGGTRVEPLTTKTGQDTVSEQPSPETLLPP
jgi:tetratricopeptide (TPR) repeat protein